MESNDNDGVFVADSDIDQALRSQNHGRAGRPQSRSRKSGNDATSPELVNEETPLLGGGHTSDSRESTDTSNSERPPWFGSAEFEGLAWWERPSVRTLFEKFPYQT